MQQLQKTYAAAFAQYPLAIKDIVYQCCLDTKAHYYLAIESGQLSVQSGVHSSPTVTLFFPDKTAPLLICEGKLDPMTAFLEGQFRSDGHLLLVMQYLMLFGTLSAQADLR